MCASPSYRCLVVRPSVCVCQSVVPVRRRYYKYDTLASSHQTNDEDLLAGVYASFICEWPLPNMRYIFFKHVAAVLVVVAGHYVMLCVSGERNANVFMRRRVVVVVHMNGQHFKQFMDTEDCILYNILNNNTRNYTSAQ